MQKTLFALCLILMLAACQPPPSPPADAPTRPPAATPSPTPPAPPTPTQASSATPAAGLPLPGAPRYTLALTLSDDLQTVSGTVLIDYTNNETVALNALYLWLFPNLLGGALSVSNVTVDGVPASPELSMQGALMRLPLAAPLAPGQSLALGMGFVTTVPTDPARNYGILSLVDGVLALAHFYPMLAAYDENGWNTAEPSRFGDIVYADAAFFDVRLDTPAGLVLAASGDERAPTPGADGRQVIGVQAGPVRDFYIAASPNYQVVSAQSGAVDINLYLLESQRPRAQPTLEAAARSLAGFSARYAAYPYGELDFVVTPNFALGIEYPGIIALTSRLFEPYEAGISGLPPAYLESTVVHEVAHQWFYNLVGNDQVGVPWLDESLSQFATWQYYVDRGAGEENGFKDSLSGRWAGADYAPIAIDQPVSAFDEAGYSAIVYGRGPLFVIKLRETMGVEPFDAFLRDYVAAYTWGTATTAGFQSLAEKYCACDLGPLFEKWVYP